MSRYFFIFAALIFSILVVFASGAFTSVSADREAEVRVEGDADAQLILSPHDGPNGEVYAKYGTNGLLRVNFCTIVAEGVNVDASTYVGDVFDITNNGDVPVRLRCEWFGDNRGNVTMVTDPAGHTSGTGYWEYDNLGLANTVVVSILVDSHGLSCDSGLIDMIVITATCSE